MSSRKTLKSVSVEGLKPTITLTPVIEPCGEGCRIHHIKSDSIVHDGRDVFVPLRHVSKQKRRIFELEEENAELREQVTRLQADWESERDYADQMEAKEKRAVAERREYVQKESENAKLRELCTEMLWSMKGAHGYYKGEAHATLMTRSIHDGKPDPTVEISLSLAEEIYEDRMRELGIEVK